MPLHITYKGRVVVHREKSKGGLLLKLQALKPGERGEYVTVSEADWQQHGRENYLEKKPTRSATRP